MKKSAVVNMILEKIKENAKACPLATMLVVSAVVLSLAGVIIGIKGGYNIKPTMEKPMLAYALTNAADDEISGDEYYEEEYEDEYQEDEEGIENEIVDAEDAQINESTSQSEELTGTAVENTGQAEEVPSQQIGIVEEVTSKTSDPANGVYLEVKKKYFDDALFIGDSRVEGLKLYSELDNATFYCKEGISLTKILKEKFVKIKIKGKKKEVSIARALKEKSFSKIYLMVGINEVSYRDTKEFKSRYKTVVDKIKELQPNAKIIIMGMMKVSKAYSSEHTSFSNKNIEKKNNAIATLADNVNVFYLDFNPEICDSQGNVKSKYTWDGVHLKAEYYSIWVNYLKKHGI